MGKLANGGRFPYTVDAKHQHHSRLGVGNLQRFRFPAENIQEKFFKDEHHLIGFFGFFLTYFAA